MKITLGERTIDHVRIYFEKTQNDTIRRMLPSDVTCIEQAIANFEQSLLPDATSYGRTVCCDGQYIGDIWCYCINPQETPNAMLSYCIFEQEFWNRGIACEAVSLFLKQLCQKYTLQTVGVFTFADNLASIRVLEKNGFTVRERFTENGRESCYLERSL